MRAEKKSLSSLHLLNVQGLAHAIESALPVPMDSAHFQRFSPRPFRPAWWLQGGHLQTLWQPLVRRPPAPVTERERLETADGDFLDLDWSGDPAHPQVLLLHGLAGSSRSPSIAGLQHQLTLAGFRVAALNFRGCSGESNRTWKIYHSGETSDLAWVIDCLRQRAPNQPLFAAGFSLGGNVLLKHLGESAAACHLDGALACSVPMRLDACASRLDRGLSRLYRNQLLKELNDYLDQKMEALAALGHHHDLNRLRQLGPLRHLRSFWTYDNQVVAPLYGFQNAEDYYQKSSSSGYLKGIRKPTLILHARDDPFMTEEVLPREESLPPAVTLLVTPTGGHVGFIEGWAPFQPRYWLEDVIPHYFLSLLPAKDAAPPNDPAAGP